MKPLSLSLLALTLFSAGALAVTNTYQLTSEADVPSLYQQTLPDFWRQHAVEGEFKGKDGVTIRYAALRQEKVDRAILIVNGRVESYLKYQELAWDLWRQGYSSISSTIAVRGCPIGCWMTRRRDMSTSSMIMWSISSSFTTR